MIKDWSTMSRIDFPGVYHERILILQKKPMLRIFENKIRNAIERHKYSI